MNLLGVYANFWLILINLRGNSELTVSWTLYLNDLT